MRLKEFEEEIRKYYYTYFPNGNETIVVYMIRMCINNTQNFYYKGNKWGTKPPYSLYTSNKRDSGLVYKNKNQAVRNFLKNDKYYIHYDSNIPFVNSKLFFIDELKFTLQKNTTNWESYKTVKVGLNNQLLNIDEELAKLKLKML
jgi:hypothetical protein